MVKRILHLEGAAFFLTSLYFFHYFHGNWILFIIFLFVPDVSMIGYLKEKELGAAIYNLVHNYLLGLLVIFLGVFLLHNNVVTSLGIIFFAHVALDRCLGYGLKYPTAFKNTHLQKV